MKLRRKKVLGVFAFLFCLTLTGSGLMVATQASPGALDYQQAKQEMEGYKQYIVENVQNDHGDLDRKLLVVGHRGGSFQEYPKNLALKLNPYSTFLDVVKILERSFDNDELGIDQLEIDAQQVKLGKKVMTVVTHDKVNIPTPTRAQLSYAENNTLEKVLHWFVHSPYPRQKKSLILEIKVEKKWSLPHPKLNDRDHKLIDDISQLYQKVLSGAAANLPPQALGFASFNYFALEKMAKSLPAARGVGYYQIVTTNKAFLRPVAMVIQMPFFSRFLQEKIRHSPWLTGLWFDPYWLKKIPSTLNGLQEGRKRPLSHFISTYGLSKFKFQKKMKGRKGELLKNVRGLIFDIQKHL